ncbi:hypothetical protein BGW41_005718 [Actinomortierella wolfii]|nr:hypothetical protein BGW41_005718 [Actinomortierella wolfii]
MATDDQIRDKLETIEDVLATTTDKFEISEQYLLSNKKSDFGDDEEDEDDIVGGEDFLDPLQRKRQRRRLHISTTPSTSTTTVVASDKEDINDDSDSLPDISEDEFLRQRYHSTSGSKRDYNHNTNNNNNNNNNNSDADLKVKTEEQADGPEDNEYSSAEEDESEDDNPTKGSKERAPAKYCLYRAFNTPVWSVVEDSLIGEPFVKAEPTNDQNLLYAAATTATSPPPSSSTTTPTAAGAPPSLERDSLGRFEFNILWDDFQKWFAWHGASVANTFTVSRSNYHYKRGSRAGQVRMHYSCCLNNKQQKKKHRGATGKITQYFQADRSKSEAADGDENGESEAIGSKRKLKKGASKITAFFRPTDTASSEGGSASPLNTKDDQSEERPCKAGFTATKMVGVRQDGQGGEVEYCHIVYAYKHNHPLDHHPVPGLPLKLEGVKERIKSRLARGTRLDRVLRRLLVEYIEFRPPLSSMFLHNDIVEPEFERRTRDDALTLADIFDIWYQLTIKEELKSKAPTERDSCRMWMRELKNDGYITMTEPTPQGDLYGWTSLWQLEHIKQYGGVLNLDRDEDLFRVSNPRDSDRSKFFMYTLSVLHHECRIGVPVATLICPKTRSQENLETWLCFVLASMRTTLGLDYIPQGVCTYLGAVEAGALQQVFPDSIVFPGAMYYFAKKDTELNRLVGNSYDPATSKFLSELKTVLAQGYGGLRHFDSLRSRARQYNGLVEYLEEHYFNEKLRGIWFKFLNTKARYFPGDSLRFDRSRLHMLETFLLEEQEYSAITAASLATVTGSGEVAGSSLRSKQPLPPPSPLRVDHVIGVMARLVLPNYRWTLHPSVWPRRLKYVNYLSSEYTEVPLEEFYSASREVYVPTVSYRATPKEWVKPASKLPPRSLEKVSNRQLAYGDVDTYTGQASRDDGPSFGFDDGGDYPIENGRGGEDEDEQVSETEEDEVLHRKTPWKNMARGGPKPSQIYTSTRDREERRQGDEDAIQSMLDDIAKVYQKRVRGAEIDLEEEILLALETSYRLIQRAVDKQQESERNSPYQPFY